MKQFMIIILFLSSVSSLYSQTAADALRYSRILDGGTARYQGLGGAVGAVGGDFSSVMTNPGGLGLYSSSEFTFSPELQFEGSHSNYNSESNNANKLTFGMGDLGLVFHLGGSDKSSGFRGFNIAFGVNRQLDFNNKVYMEGVNNKNSLLSSYVNTLNNTPGGVTPQMINDDYPFDIALAYNSDLIYLADSVNKKYANDAPNGGVIQSKSVTTEGSINEYDFAFGANYNDRLYFGVTIGVPVIRYYENTQYREVKNDTAIHYFNNMTYNQQLETHGTGINLKLGVIYRPANWVRIGAAIHTPTYYGNMRDNWSSDMNGDLTLGNFTSYSPLGGFDYQLVTPFRAIGSVAFFVGNYGLISGEYEYVNYSQSYFSSGDASFSTINDQIKNQYKSPVNVRFGTEWRIRRFRVRGGFGYYGSPYQSNPAASELYVASIGWGYRARHFFVDMTYRWTQMKEDYYFYDPTVVNPSLNTYNTSTVTTTFGFRF